MFLDGVRHCRVQVPLIHADQARYTEVLRQIGNAVQVVLAAQGGLGNHENEVRARYRGNYGTADARRTVYKDEFPPGVPGNLPRFFAHGAHQFPGVFFRDAECRMHHGAVPGIRYKPLPVDGFGKGDGFFGAEPDAYPAAFTGDRIDLIYLGALRTGGSCHGNCVKTAHFHTFSTACALFGDNGRPFAAGKLLGAPNLRIEDQVQVGGIHITVRQYGIFGECRKGGNERGFAGAAFAAYDNQFFHVTVLPAAEAAVLVMAISICSSRPVNSCAYSGRAVQIMSPRE